MSRGGFHSSEFFWYWVLIFFVVVFFVFLRMMKNLKVWGQEKVFILASSFDTHSWFCVSFFRMMKNFKVWRKGFHSGEFFWSPPPVTHNLDLLSHRAKWSNSLLLTTYFQQPAKISFSFLMMVCLTTQISPFWVCMMLCLSVVLGVFAPFDRTVTHVVGGFPCLFLLRVVNDCWLWSWLLKLRCLWLFLLTALGVFEALVG